MSVGDWVHREVKAEVERLEQLEESGKLPPGVTPRPFESVEDCLARIEIEAARRQQSGSASPVPSAKSP